MNIKTITVRMNKVYGKVMIKPVCEVAQGFCNLLKQSTLTRENIAHIKAMGYQVEVKEERA